MVLPARLQDPSKKGLNFAICMVVEHGHYSAVVTQKFVAAIMTILEREMKSQNNPNTTGPIFDVTKISDTEILEEYVNRFTIKAGESIRSAKDAASHFRAFFADASKKEKFVVCFLNGQHQVLSTEVLFEGSLTSSAVYPREVITRAIDLGAAAVILGHNHPSGLTTPSSSDRAVTRKLQTALNAIDVEVLDHIIIGGAEHYSFADNRLLE